MTCSVESWFLCREGCGFDTDFMVWVLFLQLPWVLKGPQSPFSSAWDWTEGRQNSSFQKCHGGYWVPHPGPYHQGTSSHTISRTTVTLLRRQSKPSIVRRPHGGRTANRGLLLCVRGKSSMTLPSFSSFTVWQSLMLSTLRAPSVSST